MKTDACGYNEDMNIYMTIGIVVICLWMFFGFSGAVKSFKQALDTDMPASTSNSAAMFENISNKNRETNEKSRKMIDDLHDKMNRKF